MDTEGKDIIITPDYVVGLTEGEGCFLVSLRKDGRIDIRFFITQAIGNKTLLEAVQKFFNVGSVYQKSNVSGKLPAYTFEVTKKEDIYSKVIPFFEKYKLKGYKAKSFNTFAEIAKIVRGRQNKNKLSIEELKYITKIRSGMNKHYS